MEDLKKVAAEIGLKAVEQVTPDKIIPAYLNQLELPEDTFLLAIGKAAWGMAKTAKDHFKEVISRGIVLTNYGNSQGRIPGLTIYQAGHPFPDDNSLKFTDLIIDSISSLTSNDHLLILLSGGGSALLEKPQKGLTLQEFNAVIRALLLAGCDIYELNTVRKHLSAVKGGRLAETTQASADILSLSDVMGDDLSIIASGPFSADPSSSNEVRQILEKYRIEITAALAEVISRETPFEIRQLNHKIIGNNRLLCEAAAKEAEKKGFRAYLYPAHLQGNAVEMGNQVGKICQQIKVHDLATMKPCAVIMGGETTVKVQGDGVGGRNLELLLAVAPAISGMSDIAVCALASDGIDGNSPAAGGIIDGKTFEKFRKAGEDLSIILENNDSYSLLQKFNAVLETGSTGTNVNDIVIILIG